MARYGDPREREYYEDRARQDALNDALNIGERNKREGMKALAKHTANENVLESWDSEYAFWRRANRAGG